MASCEAVRHLFLLVHALYWRYQRVINPQNNVKSCLLPAERKFVMLICFSSVSVVRNVLYLPWGSHAPFANKVYFASLNFQESWLLIKLIWVQNKPWTTWTVHSADFVAEIKIFRGLFIAVANPNSSLWKSESCTLPHFLSEIK